MNRLYFSFPVRTLISIFPDESVKDETLKLLSNKFPLHFSIVKIRARSCLEGDRRRSGGAGGGKEVAHTQISLAIVTMFILCHSVRWVPNTWELAHLGSTYRPPTPPWIQYTNAVSHLLITLSCSINW